MLEPSVIDRIPGGRKVSIERETFPALVADGALFAHPVRRYWVDAGTPDTYLQVQLDLIDGTRGARRPAVAVSAKVADTASIERSALLDGVVVEAGATVRDSLIMAGATIGEGAVVTRSIVGPAAVVGAGADLRDLTVIGGGYEVEPGTQLAAIRLPDTD